MSQEFDELLKIANLLGSSTHPTDEQRFKKFLASTKNNNFELLTLGNFRDIFEEANGKKTLTEDRYKMVDGLYEKYKKVRR